MSDEQELPIGNLPPDGFMVGGRGDKIVILAWRQEVTKEQALNLAAWLAVLADPAGDEFEKYLAAVRNT